MSITTTLILIAAHAALCALFALSEYPAGDTKNRLWAAGGATAVFLLYVFFLDYLGDTPDGAPYPLSYMARFSMAAFYSSLFIFSRKYFRRNMLCRLVYTMSAAGLVLAHAVYYLSCRPGSNSRYAPVVSYAVSFLFIPLMLLVYRILAGVFKIKAQAQAQPERKLFPPAVIAAGTMVIVGFAFFLAFPLYENVRVML
ncbi:MAG: hypothetical protein LBU36_06765 [Clostridiales bacterium]|jgi:hypothetical protein|nr:hypothetical protein [Clostridiales bacterium]